MLAVNNNSADRQKTERLDTKSRLLQVAAQKVHLQGFFQTSLDEIAVEADIAKATIYHHFKNKEALGKALIDFNVGKYLRFLKQDIFSTELFGMARLRKLCAFVAAEFGEGGLEQGCPICNLVSELANQNESFRIQLDGFFQEYRGFIVATLKQAVERGEIFVTPTCRTQIDSEAKFEGLAAMFLAQLQGSILLARTAIRQKDHKRGVQLIESSFTAFFGLLNAA